MFAFKSRKVRTVQLRVHQQYSSDSSHNDAASALCFFDCKMDQRLATASTVSYGHPYEFPSAVGSMYYSDNSSDYAVAAPGHGFYNFPQFGQAAYGHPAQWSCDYPATAPSYCSSPPSARASSAYMIYEDNAHRDLHDSGISQGMSPVDEKPHAEYLQLGAPTSHEGIVEDQQMLHQPVQYTGVRVVKKKVTANKKERRRTISINSAFSNLRECIPNVPVDTKLSKIKTLRLATSYIVYLMNLLEDDEDAENGENGKSGASLGCEGFKVDLQRFKRGSKGGLVSAENKLVHYSQGKHHGLLDSTKDGGGLPPQHSRVSDFASGHESASSHHEPHAHSGQPAKRSKGRTGWPQHVWAHELKLETPSAVMCSGNNAASSAAAGHGGDAYLNANCAA